MADALALHCALMMHKIAGPLYRVKMMLRGVGFEVIDRGDGAPAILVPGEPTPRALPSIR